MCSEACPVRTPPETLVRTVPTERRIAYTQPGCTDGVPASYRACRLWNLQREVNSAAPRNTVEHIVEATLSSPCPEPLKLPIPTAGPVSEVVGRKADRAELQAVASKAWSLSPRLFPQCTSQHLTTPDLPLSGAMIWRRFSVGRSGPHRKSSSTARVSSRRRWSDCSTTTPR